MRGALPGPRANWGCAHCTAHPQHISIAPPQVAHATREGLRRLGRGYPPQISSLQSTRGIMRARLDTDIAGAIKGAGATNRRKSDGTWHLQGSAGWSRQGARQFDYRY